MGLLPRGRGRGSLDSSSASPSHTLHTLHDLPRWIEQNLPNEVRERCYFFNSFFYKKLTEKQKVKRGGKMVDEEEDEHLWQQVPPDV